MTAAPLSPYTLTLTRDIGCAFHIASRGGRIFNRAAIKEAYRHEPHRTAVTGWSPAQDGTAPNQLIVEPFSSGVTRGHYDRYSYQDEKRALLNGSHY